MVFTGFKKRNEKSLFKELNIKFLKKIEIFFNVKLNFLKILKENLIFFKVKLNILKIFKENRVFLTET